MNVWAEEGTPTTLDQMGQPVQTAPMVIGSVRLAVRVSTDAVNDRIHLSIMLHSYSYSHYISCDFL